MSGPITNHRNTIIIRGNIAYKKSVGFPAVLRGPVDWSVGNKSKLRIVMYVYKYCINTCSLSGMGSNLGNVDTSHSL